MIARIMGTLIELNIETNTVLMETDALVYELLIPGYAVSDLSQRLRQEVTLHTLEYFEGSSGGNQFVPRMIGFPRAGDKAFFQRFISVKGIGIRKALRALAAPLSEIATSIECADTKRVTLLPEIGKRMAEQSVAELKGKMEDYALATGGAEAGMKRSWSGIEREALEILLQLGERRSEAEDMIDQVKRTQTEIQSTDALVQAVYRLKTGTI